VADDYLTKPFGVRELISRIKALLRRSNYATDNQQDMSYENISMNHKQRIVRVDGAAIVLRFKEYELLHYLLANVNIVLNRDKILEAVWGYDFEGESRTLDVHIKSLRQKLGTAGEHIKTVRNVGYRLGE
jgi:two-component system alkaline phosphatase synthesis response regulator PhoP